MSVLAGKDRMVSRLALVGLDCGGLMDTVQLA